MFTPEQIAAEVRRTAEAVARGGTRTQRDDFADDALGLLFGPRDGGRPRIALYDPAKGGLGPWLASTLRNAWRSRQRSERRHRLAPLTGDEPAGDPPPFPWERLGDLLGSPFGSADQGRIAGWKAGERVDMLALSGLWLKLPPAEWESYLVAAEGVYRVTLPRPFPPPGVSHESPADRQQRIAKALGIRGNTLAARWKRKKHLLADLGCLRDLHTALTDRGTNR